MSKPKNLKIDDEFWNDCLAFSDPYSKPKLKKISNANKKNKTQNINPIKTFFNDSKRSNNNTKLLFESSVNEKVNPQLTLNQISKNNRKNIREALIKESLIPYLQNKKKENLIKDFMDKYNRHLIYKKQKYEDNEQQKMQKEKSKIEECTFKPEKCINKRLERRIKRKFDGMNIYERNIKYTQKHHEKVAFLLNEVTKINNSVKSAHCFFQPALLNANVEKILYDKNNIWKEQANNDSNKLFLLRYIKARDEEFYKIEKLNNSINKKLKTSLTQPRRLIKSISQKDSLIYKKTLHDMIYSLGNILVDEEDENNNANGEKKLEDNDNYNDNENDKKNVNDLQWTFAKKF